MGLKSTRIILSILIAVAIAVSSAFGILCLVSQLTISEQDFYIKAFVTDDLVEKCDEQLTRKYTALSVKSNIPLDIFESVKMQYPTRDSLIQAMTYVFDENDSTLNTDVRTAYFENIISQYLEANKISLKESVVKAVAEEATQIYSDTVGVHNMDYLKYQVKGYQQEYTKKLSIFVLMIAVSVFSLLTIYKKKENALAYIADGALAGGFAVAVSSLAFGKEYYASPYFYGNVFSSVAKKVVAYNALGGVALFIIGVVLFGLYLYYVKRRKNREDTRFSKIITKL